MKLDLRLEFTMQKEHTKIRAVLQAHFDRDTAEDSSGNGNHGAMMGCPVYDEGYDGGRSIRFQNPFGRHQPAAYLLFRDLKGLDLTQDDYTIMFWYRTCCGGTQAWAASWDVCQAGWGVDMPGVTMGGVVCANRDAFDFDATGIMAAQLPLHQYFSVGVTGLHGMRQDMDGIWEPQDGRWHHLTVVCCRERSYCSVYVDGNEKATVDLSAFRGQSLGVNTLAVGADPLGQYGLGNAWVDQLEVYAGVWTPEMIQAQFASCRVKLLAHEIAKRIALPNAPGTQAEKSRLTKQVEAAQEAIRAATQPEAQRQLYRSLRGAYESYLAKPQEHAALAMLMCSDLHIREAGDASATALTQVFQDLEGWDAKLDGIVNPGDFAAGASAAVANAAYGVMDRLMERHPRWQMISCLGNHEINYVSPEENYFTGSHAFWTHMQRYLSGGPQRKFGLGVLDSVQNDSYAMTLKGYHFLALSTDYLPQVGDGRTDWDSNALDPIRHGLFLSEDSFAWLESCLERYSQDHKPIFVLSHSPFVDTVPLSYFRRIRIRDNSVGPQDSRLRNLLGRFPGVVYLCGHLHLSLGVTGPVMVEGTGGGRFVEITLPSFLNAKRGYREIPASWIMYVYEREIVLRARNFLTGQWLTDYDCTLTREMLYGDK